MWKNQAFLPDRYFLKLAFKFLFRCWQPCKYGKAHVTEHESTKLKPKLDMLVQAGTSIFALWKVILLKKRIWKSCQTEIGRDGQWMERHTAASVHRVVTAASEVRKGKQNGSERASERTCAEGSKTAASVRANVRRGRRTSARWERNGRNDW